MENLEPIQMTYLTFGGMIVRVSPRIGADSALLIRLSYDDFADRTVLAAGSCFHSFFFLVFSSWLLFL